MRYFILSCCLITCLLSFAQQKPTELDKSPMDISYWPNNYPLLKMTGKTKDVPVARIIYSRPQKNNRIIFGGIIKYNDMWRLGANEATEIELFKNVSINDKIVKKGRYSLFCIPNEKKWTLIINTDNYSWGNFSYDIKKDVARIDAPVEKNNELVEAFTMFFDETAKGAKLNILWDDVSASVNFTILPDNITPGGKKK